MSRCQDGREPLQAAIESYTSWRRSCDLAPGESCFAVNHDTARFLQMMVSAIRPRRVVEFGSGVSTRIIAETLAACHFIHLIEGLRFSPEAISYSVITREV